jgi:hypothetical protein
MAENIQRNIGRGRAYRYDKEGVPSEFGPFIGTVKNNVDPTRKGRLQVYIEQFGGENPDDQSNWRTINYASPFYGDIGRFDPNQRESITGSGAFVGNKHSYGMWFTPPDIGTKVICVFVGGQPDQGYYIACVPSPGLGHMLPAVGASNKYVTPSNAQTAKYLRGAPRVPVTEINDLNTNVIENPRYYDQPKPVHDVLVAELFRQGLITDEIRGPISSSSHRESPSKVFGISTPGLPIYEGGLDESTIKSRLETGSVTPEEIKVVGRRGGHTLVMDDGDIEGKDQMIRIRTAKGHQITMSDDGDSFYIIHANGQTWLELGKEGTVDVFSTNSVNVRTQGSINLHADKDINISAGNKLNLYGKQSANLESLEINQRADTGLKMYSKGTISAKSDQSIAMQASKTASIDGGDSLKLEGGCVDLNGGGAFPAKTVTAIRKNKLPDTKFDGEQGWQVESGQLETIATRAPTHEPYPYHGLGIENSANLGTSPVSPAPSQTQSRLQELQQVVPDGLTLDQFTSQTRVDKGLANLNPDQVTGMMAQLSKETSQSYNDFSVELGIGKFGISPEQLEATGYLKPGTVKNFLGSPGNTSINLLGQSKTDLEKVLSNTNVWTNKGGATDLTSFLGSESIQDTVIQDVYRSDLSKLKANGVIKGTEDTADVAGMLNASAKHGNDDVIAWVKGNVPRTVNSIRQTARNAQFATKFVDSKITPDLSGFSSPGGFANTTQSDGVDAGAGAFISNGKVPPIKYS